MKRSVDRASWSNPREVGLYQLTAEAIKAAFSAGLLQEADLWRTDAELWRKLRESSHPEVRALVRLISPATRFVEDREAPTIRVPSKVRSIDPPVLERGRLKRLSELDRTFDDYRKDYHAHKQGGCSLRVLGP